MKNIFEKFVKNLENLENYYILTKEKDYLIVSTKLTIVRLVRNGALFQEGQRPRNIELSVFFLLKITKNSLDIEKYFLKHEVPILDFDKRYLRTFGHDEREMSNEETEEILELFIKEVVLK